MRALRCAMADYCQLVPLSSGVPTAYSTVQVAVRSRVMNDPHVSTPAVCAIVTAVVMRMIAMATIAIATKKARKIARTLTKEAMRR